MRQRYRHGDHPCGDAAQEAFDEVQAGRIHQQGSLTFETVFLQPARDSASPQAQLTVGQDIDRAVHVASLEEPVGDVVGQLFKPLEQYIEIGIFGRHSLPS
ncbi:hypothetical protein NONI108955_25405 [Nocardia ninae]